MNLIPRGCIKKDYIDEKMKDFERSNLNDDEKEFQINTIDKGLAKIKEEQQYNKKIMVTIYY